MPRKKRLSLEHEVLEIQKKIKEKKDDGLQEMIKIPPPVLGEKSFGEKLQFLRINKELTQKEVADFVGISQAVYSRYENDMQKQIKLYVLLNLASLFHVESDDLIGARTPLEHLPEYLREFVSMPDSLPYINEAYIKYIQDQAAKMKPYYIKKDDQNDQ